MNMLKNRNKAFTIIEIIVVIVVISLLAVIVVGNINQYQVKSRDTKRKIDLRNIAIALEIYRAQNGSYPDVQNYGNICASDWSGCWAPGGTFANALSPYLTNLPQDPKFPGSDVSCGRWFVYVYQKLSSNTYCLAGTLENTKDPDRKPCAQSCHNTWPNYYFTNK